MSWNRTKQLEVAMIEEAVRFNTPIYKLQMLITNQLNPQSFKTSQICRWFDNNNFSTV